MSSAPPQVNVSQPAFNVNGRERPALGAGLLSLVIAEDTRGLYSCEAKFGNWGDINGSPGYLYFDRSVLEFGKSFKVLLDQGVLFEGRVMALEAQYPESGPPALVVLAEDRFQDLRMTRRTRTFDNQSDSATFNQRVGDHGLAPQINVNGPTYIVLNQVNQSDLAFMRERARRVGIELWLEGSTLHVQDRAGRAGQPLTLNLGAGLREFTVLADLANQRTSLTVSGWDVSGKTALSYDAGDSALQSELSNDQSGASILSSALGDRKESLVHSVPRDSQETQTLAEAHFRARARRFVTGRGVAETSARLQVGATLDLHGLGPLFSGKYYVSEARHLFDQGRGLRTEFAVERPGLGRP